MKFKVKLPEQDSINIMTEIQLKKIYKNEVNTKMMDNLGDGAEWRKWYFLYDDLEEDLTTINDMLKVLTELGYKIERV